MAETSRRNSKCKTDNKKVLNKAKRKKDYSWNVDSKTPPYPYKNSSSIEELFKQRKNLQEELNKINKYSESDIKNKQRKENKKHKYSSKIYEKKNEVNRDYKRASVESSPECNEDIHMESEDEETIIELRRKRRKQLLEKLNITHEGHQSNETDKSEIEKYKNHSENDSSVSTINEPKLTKQETDMFSENYIISDNTQTQVTVDNTNSDNWDDPEGYYNIHEGDIINKNRYTIKKILGKGVFANVVHAQDKSLNNDTVAIKIIRNNELMYKTGLKEIETLKEINNADPECKYHCVKLLRHFMHKGHLCLVFESLHMDLRAILKKYGRNHGINMKALMSYSRQLLTALRLLKKLGIIHADIKPDNILVNEKKNILKLCDFGSAIKVNDNEPTPYLVSRFYRAPEIILGIPYRHEVDIWSTACTIYEMATGKILFTGDSNNKMLKCFMDVKGKVPMKLLRKGKFKDQHFNYNNNFLLLKKDELTGRENLVEMTNIVIGRDLYKELKKYCKNLTPNEEKKLAQLKDLLDKMLMLDYNQRLATNDCLKHPFIQEELQR